ncbi:MAG: G/U mismatch-specific DNA glycosylase [Acidobacteria bacterium]|nr:G/U mismatch-specific DNA glycosylase [Acidobacteriota bacterium]MCA1639769.1 G/U mismatch-specific DNA glycosylase [Acidobacteriota bacterium]
MKNFKPTKEDLRDATRRTTEDLIDYNLKVLFCGINPGIWSGATGFHFAKPGNRFWKALHLGGFSNRVLHPSEEHELLENGYGITSFCKRTTATAAELSNEEIIEGGKSLVKKIKKYKPQFLAVLGIGAFRTAFNQPKAKLGLQEEKLGATRIWLLPNPSGLNAHYQLNDLAKLFGELHQIVSGGK